MNDKTKRILCLVLGVVMGGWLSFFGARELLHSKQLADHGQVTQAQVLDGREHVSGRLRHHTYYLRIAFTPSQGRPVEREVKVSRATYDATRVGGPVKAYYLPEDPTVCAAGETVDLRYGSLLMGLAALGGAIFLAWTLNQPTTEDRLAQKLEGQLKLLTTEHFDYAPVRAEEFTHLDLGFYQKGRAYLEERGFRFLADQENLSARSDTAERTCLRVFVSGDQAVVGFLYHFKSRQLGGKESKVLDLESWFSNGQFVTTSNAQAAGKLDTPPGIHALHLPASAGWDQILEAHQKQVSEFLAQHPGAEAVKLPSFEEVRRFQNELQRTKAAYRRAHGFSKAELERVVSGRAGINVEQLHAKLMERLRQPAPTAAGA